MNKTKLEQDIKDIETKLSEMKEELKQYDKLRLQNMDGHIVYANMRIEESEKLYDKNYLNLGRKRATGKLAKELRDNSNKRDLLEAYARQIDPNWEADWSNNRFDKNMIYYEHEIKKYSYTSRNYVESLGSVYMSKETAETICKALNSGEITL